MFKVNIESLVKDISWSKELPTEQEAQAWLNSQIGKPHRLPQREKNVSECSQEELDSALEILPEVLDGDVLIQEARAVLPATFTSIITDITAQKAQEEINAQNKVFLANTDWQVLRHRDQLDANISTSLTNEEYLALLAARQTARNAIID